LECRLPPDEWTHRVTDFDQRDAIALLNFVFLVVYHVDPSLRFQLHIVRNPFEHTHLVRLLMSFALSVNWLQLNAWDPLEEVTFFFQLGGEGLDLLPDELRQISVQTGVHMV
jgi:hypothetical protein